MLAINIFTMFLCLILIRAVAKLQVSNDWHEKWFTEVNDRLNKLEDK